jgi:HPt (histidine-containing phosphotransfer) domain-containing protein
MTLDDLRAYGADVDEGLGRCMGKEAIYLRLIGKMQQDKSTDALEAAIAAGDLDAAFDAAHGLKGPSGNLALTPIFEPVREITEHLRAREQMDYAPLMAKIRAAYDALVALG